MLSCRPGGGEDYAVLFRSTARRLLQPIHFGQHYLRYPGTTAPPVGIPSGTVRNHDWSNAGEGTRWEQIHTSTGPDVFEWDGMDQWVNTHRAEGREIVYCLMGTPAWAVAASAVGNVATGYGPKANMVPDDLGKLTAFATAMVNRYKDRVRYWEGWNEPNLLTFYGGTAAYVASTATPAKMAEIQRVWYQAIKAADPTAVVLSPCYTSVFSGIAGWRAYLAASDGASGTGANWFDVCAYHYYCNNNSARPDWLFQMHAGVLREMATAGVRSDTPVWATEFGLITPGMVTYSDADQVRLVRIYVLTLIAMGLDRIIWYAYDDATVTGLNAASRAAWADVCNSLIGRDFVRGEVYMRDQNVWGVRMEFAEGGDIIEEFGPMGKG
jgi:hypothetical protein